MTFEGKRLAELHTCRSAEVGGAAIAGSKSWVCPEKMTLRARPDAIEKRDVVTLAVEVAVSVAGEVSRTAGDGKGSSDALARVFGSANVGLVIAKTLVFRPEFGAGFYGHAGLVSHVDHGL